MRCDTNADIFLRSASGTPVMRKSFVPQESPLVSGGKKSGGNSGGQADESMDEWELKLIGRKGGMLRTLLMMKGEGGGMADVGWFLIFIKKLQGLLTVDFFHVSPISVPFVSPSKKNQHQQESADAAAAVAFTVNTANNLPGTRSSSSTLERRVQPPSDLRSLVIPEVCVCMCKISSFLPTIYKQSMLITSFLNITLQCQRGTET